jgi:ATP/maltotriose-dependent transcriptional regulator MalT
MVEKSSMAEKCCLNCANMLTCPDILNYKCKKYEKAEADKSALSTRYLQTLQKIADIIKELQVTETGMKVAENNQKTENAPKQTKENTAEIEQKVVKESEDKPAISKRNKEIIKLIEEGKSIKEIAEELNLKPETVALELEYLLKNGLIKAHPS